jgi:hypothetical protein
MNVKQSQPELQKRMDQSAIKAIEKECRNSSSIVSYLHEWAATAAFGRGAAEGWKCKHNQKIPPHTCSHPPRDGGEISAE